MSVEDSPPRILFDMRSNVSFPALSSKANARFFGNVLSIECRKCGAYEQTKAGHHYCLRVSCPIGLLESKRRNRKRTSSLEKVFVPKLAKPREELTVEARTPTRVESVPDGPRSPAEPCPTSPSPA